MVDGILKGLSQANKYRIMIIIRYSTTLGAKNHKYINLARQAYQ